MWINNKGIVMEKGLELFNASVLQLPGIHNLQNLLMVTAAARKVGLSAKSIERSLRSFKGIPHRLEKIGNINGMDVITPISYQIKVKFFRSDKIKRVLMKDFDYLLSRCPGMIAIFIVIWL